MRVSWPNVPSPASNRMPYWPSTVTKVLLTLRYLDGIAEPVPRNTTFVDEGSNMAEGELTESELYSYNNNSNNNDNHNN